MSSKEEEAYVVWPLFSLSAALIVVITYTTVRDLMKYDHEHLSVLKDSYTVFYVTFTILSLVFKLAIIDTHLKGEISNQRVCSMFISDYMPQFFISLSSILVATKSIMMVLVAKDSLETYQKSKLVRLKRAAYAIAPLYIILFILMNLRFTRTCYRNIDVPLQEFIEFSTKSHFIMLFAMKSLCLMVIVVCFILLYNNKYFGAGGCCKPRRKWGRNTLKGSLASESQAAFKNSVVSQHSQQDQKPPSQCSYTKFQYFGFLVSFVLMIIAFITIIVLLDEAVIGARDIHFVALFYIDIFFITVLTLLILTYRQVEMQLLVDMKVYKNIDSMTDKEMFQEYEKLFISAKRVRRRLRKQKKKELEGGVLSLFSIRGSEKRQAISGKQQLIGRSSFGSNDGAAIRSVAPMLQEQGIDTSDSESEYTSSSHDARSSGYN